MAKSPRGPLLDDFEQPAIWLELENQSEGPVMVKKYKKIDFMSERRIFHPEERGLITQGETWTDAFRVKIFSIDEEMKTKLLLKLTVSKMFRVTVSTSGCSVHTVRTDDVDKQLCAYQRMEEVWDNSNYYETLRISQDATQREIRVAYLKLAKIYHPDHNNHPQAALMFERITEAYHTLSDEEVRRQYDTHLRTDPGVLSKSYWRQIFCHWNRHKAIQVGLSTLLVVTGSVVLLTSALVAPTAIGLPGSIVGTAIGSGIFASGIGGISVALSRQAAIEGNTNYKRYLKYSFWYGIAGLATGAISGGVAGSLGMAAGGGMAAVAASGAVNGGIQGLCFGVGGGIASDRWLQMIKKLRVDAIALDLAISTLIGAATGLIFQAMITTTAAGPSTIMGHAKFSAEQLAGNNGGTLLPQKTEHPKRAKRRSLTNTEPLLLENGDSLNNTKSTENKTEDTDEEQAKESVEVQRIDGVQSEPILAPLEESEDSEVKNEQEEETKEEKEDFLPPEIEEYLACEQNTVDCLNEAIDLYEAVAHTMPSHFFQFYNHTRGKKVRMVLEYTLLESNEGLCDSDGIKIIRKEIPPREMYYIPERARFIQIHFEHSTVGLLWNALCAYENLPQTYAYSEPHTRRFFVVGHSDETIHISQIRDEYEQLVQE